MVASKTLKKHASLVDRMAQAVGVDLEEAVLTGAARFDDIADAVLRCTECSDPNHCAGLLQEQPTRDAPPAYCRNSDLFEKLRVGDRS